jgi:hypothetical protein
MHTGSSQALLTHEEYEVRGEGEKGEWGPVKSRFDHDGQHFIIRVRIISASTRSFDFYSVHFKSFKLSMCMLPVALNPALFFSLSLSLSLSLFAFLYRDFRAIC